MVLEKQIPRWASDLDSLKTIVTIYNKTSQVKKFKSDIQKKLFKKTYYDGFVKDLEK